MGNRHARTAAFSIAARPPRRARRTPGTGPRVDTRRTTQTGRRVGRRLRRGRAVRRVLDRPRRAGRADRRPDLPAIPLRPEPGDPAGHPLALQPHGHDRDAPGRALRAGSRRHGQLHAAGPVDGAGRKRKIRRQAPARCLAADARDARTAGPHRRALSRQAVRRGLRLVGRPDLLLRAGLEDLPAHAGPADRRAATPQAVRPELAHRARHDAGALRQGHPVGGTHHLPGRDVRLAAAGHGPGPLPRRAARPVAQSAAPPAARATPIAACRSPARAGTSPPPAATFAARG